MQSGSCTSCTCTFFFHFRDLSLLDQLGSLARWVATVFSTWLWSTSTVLQLQHHRSRLWVVPRKSHQDSFYLVPSKASILDHSTCSMHIMYREHLCVLLDMHVVEDFSAWKAFSCSEIVFFSQEQASLVQEDHGDNHGAEHGGCLGFHWNHGVFVLLHFDLSDSFLHVQSQGKSRIHCCFNMLFLLRKNVGKESDSNVSRRRTCRFTWCWTQVETPAASMTHQEFLLFSMSSVFRTQSILGFSLLASQAPFWWPGTWKWSTLRLQVDIGYYMCEDMLCMYVVCHPHYG